MGAGGQRLLAAKHYHWPHGTETKIVVELIVEIAKPRALCPSYEVPYCLI
eukprot:COSAG02_NODE_1172_length_14106_cov_77.834725_3_plen_50_part_00